MAGSAVGGAMSLVAGNTQGDAYQDAGNIAGYATTAAVDALRDQYELTRADFAPYREIGEQALSEYGALSGIGREGLLSDEDVAAARERFKETPGYEFRFDEGTRALDRSASARGRLQSGGYGRELIRYGQGVASQEFDKYANRLAGLAGAGQQATGATAQAGTASSTAMANAYLTGGGMQAYYRAGEGTARASGYAGFGQTFNQGWQNEMGRQNNLISQGGSVLGGIFAGSA